VAAQGLAILGVAVAVPNGFGWLVDLACLVSLAGLVSYGFVVWQFDHRQLAVGAGDHWVAGGALAISVLAVGRIAGSRTGLASSGGWREVLTDLALALWGVAMIWLVVLIASEIARPRLSYDTRRWATVFPVGMFAACSFGTAHVSGFGWMATFATAWTWVACAVTAAVLTGLARRGRLGWLDWRQLRAGRP
jgi:tellurite resistance protein TehA-like permease